MGTQLDQESTGVDFGIGYSNRYSNNGASMARILCATLIKQCVFNCFLNYFLFTLTARVARPNYYLFNRDRAGGSPVFFFLSSMAVRVVLDVHVRDSVHVARWNTYKKTTMFQGKFSPIFWIVVSRREHSNKGNGAPRCGCALEMSLSCCMCEHMETAQSLWR